MKKKKKKVLEIGMKVIKPIPNNYISIQMLLDSQNISTKILNGLLENGYRN